jgi:hypothetical protein
VTLAHLDPQTLRDVATAIEARSPGSTARRRLTPEGVERLADILLAGDTPTIGFWQRYTEPTRATADRESLVERGRREGSATVLKGPPR